MDQSDGRISKQKKFHQQFGQFLQKHGMTWSAKDSETAIANLRYMLQSLQQLREKNDARAPRRFPSLQIIMDKFHNETDNDNDLPDMSDTDNDLGDDDDEQDI